MKKIAFFPLNMRLLNVRHSDGGERKKKKKKKKKEEQQLFRKHAKVLQNNLITRFGGFIALTSYKNKHLH